MYMKLKTLGFYSRILCVCVCVRVSVLYGSVLQCVAVCCSVLQCVAVCCSVLQCTGFEAGTHSHERDVATHDVACGEAAESTQRMGINSTNGNQLVMHCAAKFWAGGESKRTIGFSVSCGIASATLLRIGLSNFHFGGAERMPKVQSIHCVSISEQLDFWSAHTHTRRHVHAHAKIRAHTHGDTCTHTQRHVHTHAETRAHTREDTCTHLCWYTRTHAHTTGILLFAWFV